MLPARFWLFVPFLALALSACGGDKTADASPGEASADTPEAPLPTPAGTSGNGVTGMPPTRESAELPPADAVAVDEAALPEDAAQLPDAPADAVPLPGTAPVAPGETGPAATEPTVADAVAVLRDYYAAINAGNFSRAYSLWSDNGRASGQTADQFAAGFAQTRSVSVEIGPPSRLEAAAGSRFVQLPITLTAAQRDGSERRYTGTYTLQRAMVDGATPEQRAWRISSASLRESGGG